MSTAKSSITVQDYKDIFDANNYKKDSYEVALFITFLMNKSVSNKEMEELTGLKKSQIFSYKKVIKFNKVEELKTTPFRKVLKSCTEGKDVGPRHDPILVSAIEESSTPPRPRSKYEALHIFNEWETSPGRTTRYKHDFCPCGLPTGSTNGEKIFVHIPEFEISTQTILRLDEMYAYEKRIDELRKKVEKLEMENSALRVRVKRTSV